MITAKQAKAGTQVDRYIKEKCAEIEQQINMCMDLGLGYCKYSGRIPESIRNMLVNLGYTVDYQEDFMMGNRYIISWVNNVDKDEFSCN